MSDLSNPASRYLFVVLQIATPLILLLSLSFFGRIDLLPSADWQDAVALSLAAMQVTLAALAISIGIAAIVGFKELQKAVRARAEEIAQPIAKEIAKETAHKAAVEEIKSYLGASEAPVDEGELYKKITNNNPADAKPAGQAGSEGNVGGDTLSN